jgi:hypothetical protein
MILLAAVAALTALPSAGPVRALVEARATVRIISGERLHWNEGKSDSGRNVREADVRIDGTQAKAQLIEFE